MDEKLTGKEEKKNNRKFSEQEIKKLRTTQMENYSESDRKIIFLSRMGCCHPIYSAFALLLDLSVIYFLSLEFAFAFYVALCWYYCYSCGDFLTKRQGREGKEINKLNDIYNS